LNITQWNALKSIIIERDHTVILDMSYQVFIIKIQ